MHFDQKVINNVQSHYQTNIMELTLATFNDGLNLKIKKILLVIDGNCSYHFLIWKSYQY